MVPPVWLTQKGFQLLSCATFGQKYLQRLNSWTRIHILSKYFRRSNNKVAESMLRGGKRQKSQLSESQRLKIMFANHNCTKIKSRPKQVWRSTILSSTIHFDLVRLNFGLRLIKSKMELIEHNCCPDLVRLILCSTNTFEIRINRT